VQPPLRQEFRATSNAQARSCIPARMESVCSDLSEYDKYSGGLRPGGDTHAEDIDSGRCREVGPVLREPVL